MTTCILLFRAALIEAYSFVDCDSMQFKEGLTVTTKTLCSRKERSVLQERARLLKGLFPFALIVAIQYCLSRLEKQLREND